MKSVTLPSLPIVGGCQFGKVRYRITGRPVVFYLCHCTERQRHSSSAPVGTPSRMTAAPH